MNERQQFIAAICGSKDYPPDGEDIEVTLEFSQIPDHLVVTFPDGSERIALPGPGGTWQVNNVPAEAFQPVKPDAVVEP